MNFDSIVTSIDIWSSKIKTVIWSFIKEENKDNFVVLWVWNSISNAIRKWNILDMEEFKDNLDKSLSQAEKISWEWISWAWVNMPNKDVLKVIPEYFIVDLEEWVKNPVWMSARKLEVVAHIFIMNTNVLNNIKKAIADVWIEIIDIYPNLWATTTWITVYEEWSLVHSAIIPLWWDNVTNDIALGARVSIKIAEKLKLEYSSLIIDNNDNNDSTEIPFKKLWLDEEWTISLKYLNQIVTARYEEILQYIKKELSFIWKDWMLPEWVVLVWWWAKQKWIIELSKNILKLPSFVWIPTINDELIDTSISDPSFAAVVWNIILARKYSMEYSTFSLSFKGFIESINKIFKKIIP